MSLPSVADYTLLEKIGSGSYATVYKAIKKEGQRDEVAIKIIDKTTLSKSAVDNIVTEINLLKILNHDHIVQMKDFFWDDRHIYIVMEYCDGGDLSHFIKKRNTLPENVCRRFLRQLALALMYLRDSNVSHMDLKPQNLLLKRKPRLTLKVGDFGFAEFLPTSEERNAIRGSPLYMAPEMLLKRKYDARIDLWSVGIIMYECLFGKAPYSSSSFKELAEKIKGCRSIEIPKYPHVSAECKNLLQSLLKHDPDKRITFEEFFANPYLDLEHASSKEHYDKALELVQSAIKLDSENNIKEAFHFYCEALRYFIPILKDETDVRRKESLRLRVNEYIKRAEQLKLLSNSYVDVNGSNGDEMNKVELSQNTTLNKAKTLNLERQASFIPHELKILSRSTPSIADALEIGEVAEQYLTEKSYTLALEKFQSCLSLLVPLLCKEPPGRRRDLLHKQVQTWMKDAESTKGLIATKSTEETNQRTSDSMEQCSIQ